MRALLARRVVTFAVVAAFTALATLSWLRDDDPSAVRTATSMAARAGVPTDADWNAAQLAEEAGIGDGEADGDGGERGTGERR